MGRPSFNDLFSKYKKYYIPIPTTDDIEDIVTEVQKYLFSVDAQYTYKVIYNAPHSSPKFFIELHLYDVSEELELMMNLKYQKG